MNIPEIWTSAEKAAKLCRVIWYLRTDPCYTREEAADELEDYMKNYIAPKFTTVFDVDASAKEGG